MRQVTGVLVRGDDIDAEPADVAFRRAHEVDLSFVRCANVLLAGGAYAMFATHDPRLVEIVGDNITELETEIEKLATWAGGETIDAAGVELLAAGRAEVPIFALTDAWGARDVSSALAACEAILERTGGARQGEISRVVAQFAAHVQRVRTAQELAAEGVSSREGASRMKRNPYYVQKLFAQAANFSSEELGDVLVRISELDYAVKGGSRLASDLELERALVDTTRASGSGSRSPEA